MPACAEYETLMIQDVFDELQGAHRVQWETHLANCSQCQAERDRLHRLKTSMTATNVPSMDYWEAEKMVARIIDSANKKRVGKLNIFNRLPRLSRLVPVAAVAGLIFFAVGIFLPGDDSIRRQSASFSVEMIGTEDIEILQNLEMLREFEAVQKLVKFVDYSEPSAPTSPGDFQTRGRIGHGNAVFYS